MSKYKLVAMDLDGTLTQHKSKLDETNTRILKELTNQYACVIVGAGNSNRIFNQMNEFEIDIIGNYGMQLSAVENGQFVLLQDDLYEVDKDFFERTITELRKKCGFENFEGDNVEFHPSGAVTFPLIGTGAVLRDKLAFDPDGKKRSKIYDLVADAFSEYNCFIGGSTSFDIVKKEYNKYNSLLNYATKLGVKKEEIVYVGDDFKRGGNDESVLLGGIDCVVVSDYTKFGEVLVANKILKE